MSFGILKGYFVILNIGIFNLSCCCIYGEKFEKMCNIFVFILLSHEVWAPHYDHNILPKEIKPHT